MIPGAHQLRTTPTSDDSDAVLRCVHCGIRGRWVNGILVFAGPGTARALCSRRPPRAHGPFIPA